MILVDTSVWVDHLRKSEPVLNTLLNGNNVLMHSMVMGELACGNIHEREQALDSWHSLPKINELSHERVILLIETKNLMGRGIGFVDMHLLCSVICDQGSRLWTRDNRLQRTANELKIAFENNH